MMWKYIMLHCTATPEGRVVTKEEIDRYHRERGFKSIGYHFIVHQDGRVEEGRPLSQTGAHCKGWNHTAIGVAYIGGTDKQGNPKDTRTKAQKEAMARLVEGLKRMFVIKRVLGHNEVAATACPCFSPECGGSEALHPGSGPEALHPGPEAGHPSFDADILKTHNSKLKTHNLKLKTQNSNEE